VIAEFGLLRDFTPLSGRVRSCILLWGHGGQELTWPGLLCDLRRCAFVCGPASIFGGTEVKGWDSTSGCKSLASNRGNARVLVDWVFLDVVEEALQVHLIFVESDPSYRGCIRAEFGSESLG